MTQSDDSDITTAIQATDLVKIYRSKRGDKQALNGISLSIPRGSFFGLLGPNGAGKSTFINILAGLVTKTSGQVSVWNRDLDTDPRGVRAALGVVPQELILDAFFTPRESLEVHAGFYGVPPALRRTDEILAAVGLSDKANAYARTLSGGMRRRLLVAKAMVHSPPILVLDEPTAGVDVELRQMLWTQMKAMNEAGVTIVLTTHYLEEAEELCDHIAIINKGTVVAHDSTRNLLSLMDAKTLLLSVADLPALLPEELADFNPQVQKDGRLSLRYRPSQVPVIAVLEAVQRAGLSLTDLSTVDTDLEDIFLHLTREGHDNRLQNGPKP